jgi:penicillin amidase
VEGLSEETENQIEAYLKGVNHFIESRSKQLPLEFNSIGLKPEPWTLSDITANLVINSWYLQTNYLEEILAIRTRNKLNRARWDALFPGMSAFDGSPLPEDSYFEKLRNLKIGKFIPAAYSFYKEFRIISGASNNWISSKGPGGTPLLANDPHLGIQVPQVWFACALECPGTEILGVGMPGFPGVIIGRTPTAAWGFTNVMTDIVDLFVLRINPADKTCIVNGKEFPLIPRKEIFHLPGGRKEVRTIYDSPHGPILTEITPETDAAAALKWYGTLPENTLKDRTGEGILAFSDVKNTSDLKKNAEFLSPIGQNIVAGDVDGNIIWQVTGSIPLRKGFSGRLPADGSADHDWTGFVPYEDMPCSENPSEGFIATANNRTVEPGSPVMPTWSWAQPWRIRRIREVLEKLDKPEPEDFMNLQNDNISRRPEHVLRTLLNCELKDARAAALADILRNWDGECGKNSSACLIFNRLPIRISEILLRSYMGSDLELYYSLLPFFTSLTESITRDVKVLELFPDESTGVYTLESLMEKALVEIWMELSPLQGKTPHRWRWGVFHTLQFRHPGAEGRVKSWLLNRGPWAEDGDWTTVNVSGFNLLVNPGEVTTIPCM